MKAVVDIVIEGNILKVMLFGVCIFEHECEDEMEVARFKRVQKQFIRDIESKGNIVDKEV